MAQDLDKSPSTPFDMVYEGPTVGWTKIYGAGGGGSGGADAYWVNAKDFSLNPAGFGQGFQDDGIAIQAAIDFAFANGKTAVRIPDGSYCTVSRSIWLDPPSNMRSSGAANPTQYQFTMALIGHEVDGDGIRQGVTIEGYGQTGGNIDYSKQCDYPIIIVGPGQGMRVAGLNVQNGYGSLFTSFPEGSMGIAISGGDGGASRTMIERCWIQSLKVGIIVGWNRDALGDSNTFIKCTVEHCRYGVWIARSQNYINALYDCNIGQCTFNVYSNVGKAVWIFGGNYSSHSLYNADHTCGSTTALSSITNEAGTYLGRFSTTLSGLDALGIASFTDNGLCVFTRFGFETAHFGVVPCIFVSFNSGTSVLTLDIDPFWAYTFYGFNPDLSTATRDLQAELQAVTTVICCEACTTFFGSGIHVHGAHIENPVTVTTLTNSTTAIAGDDSSSFEDIVVNSNFNGLSGASLNKMQAATPLIFLYSGRVTEIIRGFHGSGLEGEVVVCSFQAGDLIIRGHTSLVGYNCWVASNTSVFGSFETYIARGTGIGRCDNYPWIQAINGNSYPWMRTGRGRYPTLGYRPAPGHYPEINPAMYALITAASPITTTKDGYTALAGRTMYQVAQVDVITGISNGYMYFTSNHDMYSWGQNLSVNWSYKGRSTVLYVSGTDIGYLFPGLTIGLDNGSGVLYYTITGKSTFLGYVTVDRDLAGVKTTVYTGSTISQQLYSFTYYSPPLTQPLTTLTDAATIAFNMALSINFQVTLGGNRTLGNPTNTTVGQTGVIEVIQDGTGGRTLAFDTNYKFQSASAPSLNAGVGAKTILSYWVENSTNIWVSGGYQPSTANFMQTALVTSQFDVTSNATLADVPGLSINLLAGKKYRGRAVLSVNVNATPGMKVGMSGTAGINSSGFFAHAVPWIGGATISNAQVKTATFGQITSGLSGFTVIDIDFYIDVSTAGTLTIQFSQGTSSATTVSVLVGSTMTATLI